MTTRNVVFEAASFEFETADPEIAEQLMQTGSKTGSGYPATPYASSRELASLEPWRTPASKARSRPASRCARVAALATRRRLAAILAGAVRDRSPEGRNFLSEERLYTDRPQSGTRSYRQYLAHGARPDVRNVLCHGGLQEAIAKNPFVRWKTSLRGARASDSSPVQVALKQPCSASSMKSWPRTLSPSFWPRTRAADRDSSKKNRAEARDLYQKVARSSPPSRTATPGCRLFGRLLYYAQTRAEVHIAFAGVPTTKTPNRARQSAYFMGPEQLPSRYFSPEDWQQREQVIGREIETRLNREFPADVLRFKLVPAFADDGTDTPKVDQPTLVITHTSQMSGAFMSKKPRGAFVGLGFTVRSAFIIPGDDQTQSLKFSAWLRPDLKRWEEPGATAKEIYELMANGLSRFAKKQFGAIFKVP